MTCTDTQWHTGASLLSALCRNAASQWCQQGRQWACGAWCSSWRMPMYYSHKDPCATAHWQIHRGPCNEFLGQSCPIAFTIHQQKSSGTAHRPSGSPPLQTCRWSSTLPWLQKASSFAHPPQFLSCCSWEPQEEVPIASLLPRQQSEPQGEVPIASLLPKQLQMPFQCLGRSPTALGDA